MPASGAIRAGRAYVEIFGEDSKLQRVLKANEKRLKNWGKNVAAIGAGVFAAGSAVLTPLIAATKVFDSVGSQLLDISGRTGASVEALSSLGYAAEQSGSSLEELEGGLKKQSKFLTEAAAGGKEQNEVLQRLGLTIGNLAKLSPEDQFRLIGQRLNAIQNPAAKAATAMQIFGKSGANLLPVIADLANLEKRAQQLGLIVSTEDAQNADKLGDAWTDLKLVGKALVFQVGAALAPIMTTIVNAAAEAASKFIAWVRANRELIVTVSKVAAVVAAVGAGLVVVGAVISGLGAVLGAISAAVVAFGSVLAAIGAGLAFLISPIGLAIAGLTALTVWFFTATETGRQAVGYLVDAFSQLATFVGKTFKGIKDALTAGDISLAAEVLWASLRVAWLTGTNFLRGYWESFLQGMLDAMVPVAKGIASLLIDAMFAAGKAITAVMEATGLDKILDPGGKIFGNVKALLSDKSGLVRSGLKTAAGLGISGVAADFKGASDDRLAASQAALDEARQKFVDAQERAANAAADPNGPAARALGGLSVPDIRAGLEQARTAVSGTFSAAAASGLGGSRQLDTIATNTGTTNNLLKKIANKQQAAPAFT